MIVSCLGLLGITSLIVTRRQKEIAIRRVVGLSSAGAVGLICQEFVSVIVASAVLACFGSYYAMNRFLESFAYQVEHALWPFAIALITVTALAIATISARVIKIVQANPVQVLSYE